MEKARLAAEAKKKAKEEKGDDDGSDAEKEPTPQEQPAEEEDDAPIEVDLTADSDDDFAPIEIIKISQIFFSNVFFTTPHNFMWNHAFVINIIQFIQF